ncbi:MAG: hypothetical protein HOQ28_01355 [Thermoleophilia bacterium]|nr:hypothetical protein [Thermoleophilia bacterium]
MYVTITASKGLGGEQAERVHRFLEEFLPRLKQQPGVMEILHGASPDGSDVTTVIVWESPDDAKRYRDSDLIREPTSLEAELGLDSRREGFPVAQHLIAAVALQQPAADASDLVADVVADDRARGGGGHYADDVEASRVRRGGGRARRRRGSGR